MLKGVPYMYKFLRDVNFADDQNLIFAGFDLVLHALVEEATESCRGHFEKFKIFLLQKLNSYGEP